MIRSETHKEAEYSSPDTIELAGALQAVLYDVKNRDFDLALEQEVGLGTLGSAILDGKQSGYVEMATSTGKTTLESLVAEAAVKSGKRVLMLAPKIAIARQLSGKNADKPTGLARFTQVHDHFQVGHHFGGGRARLTDNVVISTYNGFLNAAKEDFRRLGEFDVVIADECHRGLGEQTSRALLDSYPTAVKIGFSATPDFATDRRSEEVFGDKLFEFSLTDAIEAGRTAPLRTLLYETDQNVELFDNRSDFTERELAPLIENPERNGTALSLARSFVEDGRQGIIACIPGSTNVHARLMSDMLRRQEVAAGDVGSHLSDEENMRRLQAFDRGELQVLTFTRALEEGWDSDKASFAINMAPTASPVRTKQLLGRVLRKKPDERESIYIDFVDVRRGVHKNQYTALHAVDLDTVQTDRVLGRQGQGAQWHAASPLHLPNISDEILQRLLRSNGRKLDDVLMTRTAERVDPLVRHWEHVLAREGMPAELPDNDILGDRFEQAKKQIIRRLALINGSTSDITHHDIMEALEDGDYASLSLKKSIGQYGTKLSFERDEFEEPVLETVDPYLALARQSVYQVLKVAPEGGVDGKRQKLISLGLSDVQADSVMSLGAVPESHIDEFARSLALTPDATAKMITKIVSEGKGALTEREAGVIRGRFGLPPYGDEMTFDEVGDIFGVTRERIRQVESKTMAKLRHPSRSQSLAVYYDDGFSDIQDSDPKPKLIEESRPARIYERHVHETVSRWEEDREQNKTTFMREQLLGQKYTTDDLRIDIHRYMKDSYGDVSLRDKFSAISFPLCELLGVANSSLFGPSIVKSDVDAAISKRSAAASERAAYYRARIVSLKSLRPDGEDRFSSSIEYLESRAKLMEYCHNLLCGIQSIVDERTTQLISQWN